MPITKKNGKRVNDLTINGKPIEEDNSLEPIAKMFWVVVAIMFCAAVVIKAVAILTN